MILLVAYVGCKLLRNRSLPLAPASEPQTIIEPTSSYDLLGKNSCEPLSINLATFERALLRVTIDVLKATNNFSGARILGHGDNGTVYGATLPKGWRVAIKRLHCGHPYIENKW